MPHTLQGAEEVGQWSGQEVSRAQCSALGGMGLLLRVLSSSWGFGSLSVPMEPLLSAEKCLLPFQCVACTCLTLSQSFLLCPFCEL